MFSYKRFVNSSLSEGLEKEIIENEKKNKKLIFSSLSGFFSYYRLIGYMIFIFLFMYIVNQNLLEIKYYIIGMSLSFFVPLALLIFSKRKNCEDNEEYEIEYEDDDYHDNEYNIKN